MLQLSKPAAAFAVLGAACALVLSAQKPQDDETVFRSETRLVMLHATVVDKNGHLMTDLQQNSFQVFENGVEQKIKIFKREDVPVSMGLIVDNSGSMRDKRQKVEAAALALVKASNRDDEVFVVNFNDEPFLDSPDFTNDIKVLEQSLAKIDSRGGTAMRDAIRVSIDHEKLKAKRDKKVLLVITDGNDNASMISQESLVKAAQQSEILIYAIGLLSEEERREARRAKRSLDTLTEATGGQSYYPKELSDVEKICHQVAHDIRNQYIIAYTPSNTALDGTFRQVRVAANGPGRPVVRTRTGYYATPDKSVPKTSSGGS
jgi:Ca-activated chloride channel family protein